MNKKISILTPCYNGEKFLKRYFDSLLNQTYKNFEIIFVNDGSVDNTEEIVKSYIPKFKSSKIELNYIYKENGGQSSAINVGLKLVTGQYLVWPDADDYYEPDALRILATELEKDSTIAYVKGNPIFRKETDLSLINIPKPIDKNKTNFFEDYLFCTPNVCCFSGIVMIDFEKFKKANKGLDIYVSKGGQNWQLLLPISYFYSGKYIDENIYNYVVRNDSHSHANKTFKQKLNRTYVLNDILNNVLKKIDMPVKEKKQYLKLIHEKYFKERLSLVKQAIKKRILR